MTLIISAAILATLFAGNASAQSSSDTSIAIDLICIGGGTYNESHSSPSTLNANGEFTTPPTTTYTPASYTGQAYLHIASDGAQIKMPSAITPRPASPFAKKPEWSPIKDLTVTDNDISGRVPYALIRGGGSMLIRIDRITGNIVIDGSAFTGQCEPYDPATIKRKF